MPVVKLIGEVFPRGYELSITTIPSAQWKSDELGLDLQFVMTLQKSKIEMSVHCNRYSEEDRHQIYLVAYDVARTAVEIVAFKMGVAFSVIFSKSITPDGIERNVIMEYPWLAEECTSFDPANLIDFIAVYQMAISDHGVYAAFNDLIGAISFPHIGVMNCARAIDGIKHLVTPSAKSKEDGWQNMRRELQLDRNYLTLITANSTEHRHGKRVSISGDIGREVLTRSWVIMNRFIEYKKRGSKMLPQSEFPILMG
jgi:hypothetical protein